MSETFGQPTDVHIRDLVRQIVEAVSPLQIVLFGSAARADSGPPADVDLLVVMPDGTHRRRTAQSLYRAIRGVSMPFDLIVATPSDLEKHRDNPGLIYQTALTEGRAVYVA